MLDDVGVLITGKFSVFNKTFKKAFHIVYILTADYIILVGSIMFLDPVYSFRIAGKQRPDGKIFFIYFILFGN